MRSPTPSAASPASSPPTAERARRKGSAAPRKPDGGETPVPMRRQVCHAVVRNFRSRCTGLRHPPFDLLLGLAEVVVRGGLTSADACLTVVSVAPDFP